MNWKDLIKRMMDLAGMQNIPSMAAYAEEWNKLGADFQAIGFENTAANCRARFEHYRDLNPGEYVRLIEQPIAELIQVAP
jgi:hypothetical protein